MLYKISFQKIAKARRMRRTAFLGLRERAQEEMDNFAHTIQELASTFPHIEKLNEEQQEEVFEKLLKSRVELKRAIQYLKKPI